MTTLDEEAIEERLWALYEEETIIDAAKEAGIEHSGLSDWCRRNIAGYESNNKRLSDKERERRLRALRECDTVVDAAAQLGMNRPYNLYGWGRANYDNYDEEFGKPSLRDGRSSEAKQLRVKHARAIENAICSALDDLDTVEEEVDDDLVERKLDALRSELEWAAEQATIDLEDDNGAKASSGDGHMRGSEERAHERTRP